MNLLLTGKRFSLQLKNNMFSETATTGYMYTPYFSYASMIQSRLDVAHFIQNSFLSNKEKEKYIGILLEEINILLKKEIEPYMTVERLK